MKILVADDDLQLLRALRITLRTKGYYLFTAADGQEALQIAINRNPEMYIIDLGMPNLNGMQVIESIRGWSQAPILVISGRVGAGDKVQALDAGADDYITKPFAISELLARIRALGRRLPMHRNDPSVTLGAVTIDLSTHSVTRTTNGRPTPIHLTPTEWRIMEVLARNPGTLITQHMLLTEIWGGQHTRDTGYLRLYVSQIRKKVEPDPAQPRYLITEAGMGYRLIADNPAD